MDPDKLKQLTEIFSNIGGDTKPIEKPKKQRKKREYNDDEREVMRERMAKMRALSLEKRQAKAEEKKKSPPKKQIVIDDELNLLKQELENLKLQLTNKPPIINDTPPIIEKPKLNLTNLLNKYNDTNKRSINDTKITNEIIIPDVCIKEVPPNIQDNKIAFITEPEPELSVNDIQKLFSRRY